MRFLQLTSLLVLTAAATAGAQSNAVHVSHDVVSRALARGGTLVVAPHVRVVGGHRDRPGALDTQTGTSILLVTDGAGTLVTNAQSHRLTKGDLMVVAAGTAQSFASVTPSISYLLVTVPVLAAGARAEVVFVAHETAAATFRKAGPLADGPNLRVSGGYRTGPYAPADYRPDVEIHTHEADLFYVVEGRATQVLGGTIVGGRQTAPGQIRGSKIDGGQALPAAKRGRDVGAGRHAALVSRHSGASRLSSRQSLLLKW